MFTYEYLQNGFLSIAILGISVLIPTHTLNKIVCNVCADVGECSDCCFGRWTVVLLALSVVVLLVAVAVELLVPVAVVLLTSAAVVLLVLSAVDC